MARESRLMPALGDLDVALHLQEAARARLRELGAPSALKKASGSSARARRKLQQAPATPGPKTPGSKHRGADAGTGGSRRLFCRPLRDLSMVMVRHLDEDLLVPKVLVFLCRWLGEGDRLRTEGLFRKPGSASRQRQLRTAMEESEEWAESLQDASPLDVAGLVKQWLRELPEPLIPTHVQKLLLECWALDSAAAREEGILLCCCLLPLNHSVTLVYLVDFFNGVSSLCQDNKMDLSNLAIVLTPAFFPMDESAAATGRKAAGHDKLPQMLKIVEVILKSNDQVCVLPSSLNNAFTEALASSGQSEEHLDTDDCDAGGLGGRRGGPSERRTKRKKRRSGSISRVFNATVKGIQKAMSRSATPVAPRSYSTGRAADSLYTTPLPLSLAASSARFTSPRLPLKRKAKEESELSPRSKQQRKLAGLELTPKVRSRSFSAKHFNPPTSKSFKVYREGLPLPSAVSHDNASPIPRRPSLKISTPSTPTQLDLPRHGTDIMTPPPQFRGKRSLDDEVSMAEINSSMASLATTESSSGSTLSLQSRDQPKPHDERVVHRQRSKSPVPRKIGSIRGRLEKRLHNSADYPSPSSKMTSKPLLHDIPADELKTHFRKSSHSLASASATPKRGGSARSSALKAHPVTSVSSSSFVTSAARSSARSSFKKPHESLTSLRQDISSFIEQSFGASDTSGAHSSFDAHHTGNIFPTLAAPPSGNVLRRQSSAFEFSRPSASSNFPTHQPHELRRQSSAFEIAARNRANHPQSYESFNPRETRASLRRKSSSVRDLVHKIEKTSSTSNAKNAGSLKRGETLPLPSSSDSATSVDSMQDPYDDDADVGKDGNDDFGWTDASEFFKNPLPKQVLEDDYGCKRSSIVRILRENKGKVSQSVETFTKPTMPPPMAPLSKPPKIPHPSPSLNRRLSARMGVSATTPSKSSAPVKTSHSAQHRRHSTRTGIRTSVNHNHPTPINEARGQQSSTASTTTTMSGKEINVRRDAILVRTPETHASKIKRRDRVASTAGRRHKTIGYVGEVRSPLTERHNNQVATVQRSKSDQTPMKSKPAATKRRTSTLVTEEENLSSLHPMVTRSQSMRSPAVGNTVTISLPDGKIIHDGGARPSTTSSGSGAKVRRHCSERSAAGRERTYASKSPRMVRMF